MDQKDQNQERNAKTAVIKTLAIVGLFSTILLSVWLLVQVVRIIPDTFTSLASIAESIQRYSPLAELNVTKEKSIINSGEALNIEWSDLRQDGSYHFSYECTPGISLSVQARGGELVALSCNDILTLSRDIQDINVVFLSSEKRFVDVPFSISFDSSNDETLLEQHDKLTVVNAAISQSADMLATKDTGEESEDIFETEAEEEDGTETDSSSETNGEEAPEPIVPQTTPEKVVSFIPQSYESGYPDLKASYLGIGTLAGDTFVARATLEKGERGAFRFEVKNIGTKTSDDWVFTATLPGGYVYESDTQAPLRPNERIEFTLGFSVNESAQTSTVQATVTELNDTNAANNSFSWAVEITE